MAAADDRRRRLLAAARKLFGSKGFAATSTREIAAEAGCNLALISHYFGSKEGLLATLLQETFEEDVAQVGKVLGTSKGPRAQLEGFIEWTVDHFAEQREMLRVVHREIIQTDSPFLTRLAPPIEQVIGELATHLGKLPN